MKGEFISGKYYYLKLSINELKKYGFQYYFLTGSEMYYRLDNSSWVYISSISSYMLTKADETLSTPIYLVVGTTINISTNTTLEIYGKFNDLRFNGVTIPSDTNVYKYFQKSAISEPIIMNLYQCDVKRNVVDKSSNLTPMGYLFGTLRSECDFLNPVIEFEYPEFPLFNYLIIPSFKRSYFITNIINIRYGIYRIDLHVDVLNSYSEDIELQSGFVSRCSAYYSSYLVDNRLPLYDVPQITFEIPTHGLLKNTTLVSSFSDNINDTHITMGVVSDVKPTRPITKNNAEPPSGSNLPSVNYALFDNPNMNVYALNYTRFEKIANYFIANAPDLTFVCGCVSFPWHMEVDSNGDSVDLQPLSPNMADTIPFYIGDNQPTISGITYLPYLRGESTGYHVIGDFTLTSQYSDNEGFLNYEPYSQIEMFIPYHGWVKLNPIDVLDYRIIVYFVADATTGDGEIFVYNYDKQVIIYSANAQIGIKLSLTSTNAEELTRQKQANVNNLVLGLVNSTISIVGGVASENPMGVIKGITSGAKSVVDIVNANMMMFDKANVSVNGDKIGLFTGNEIIVKRTQRVPMPLGDDDVYIKNQGYPLNDYVVLSTIAELGDDTYLEIPQMRYVPQNQLWITSTEIDEIEKLASDGIIF